MNEYHSSIKKLFWLDYETRHHWGYTIDILFVHVFIEVLLSSFCFDRGNEAQIMTTENIGSVVRGRKELEPWQIFDLKFPKHKTKSYHRVRGIRLPNRIKCQRGGSFSIKNLYCRFWELLIMKLIQNRNFRLQGMFI